MTKREERLARLAKANQCIQIISEHGRRFFSLRADSYPDKCMADRVSRFELDEKTGKLWFRDKYSWKRVYVAYPYKWRGFSEGGTLRSLIQSLRDWINDESKTVPFGHFGPWQEWVCGGDLWGYGKEEMAEVRRRVIALFHDEDWSKVA